MSSRGAAFSALVVAVGVAVLPAAAYAQDPVADPAVAATPAAVPATPATEPTTPAEPAAVAEPACGPRDSEDDLTPVEAEPPKDASTQAAAADADGPPVAHCSQDAGDNQYRDPFAHSPPPDSGGGAGSSQTPDTGTSDGASTGASVIQQDPTAEAAGAAAADGPSLPNTGLGLGGLVALGLPLLAGGIALRARLA